MNKIISIMLLSLAFAANSYAAAWIKLQDNGNARLVLDKQSVLEKEKYKRAWVKVIYKTPQINAEAADKTYNLSKMLWFFDCATQTAATSQVFQYSNDELIYSAAVDYKAARFIEPVPETDIDYGMRYVCEIGKTTDAAAQKPPAADKADAAKKPEAADKKTSEDKAQAKPENKPAEERPAAESAAKPKDEVKPAENIKPEDKQGNKKHWTYEGKEGPGNWGKLSSEFATCETGRNQSPINIDLTIHAALKELKTLQRFPGKEIVNNGHTVQVNFKEGNMMVLDNVPYQMKQVHFHAPSENTIKGKSYPLEAHFVHANNKGELTVIGVMFEEGKPNEALGRLWGQMPTELDKPVALKSRVLPNEMIPQKRGYYRFSGSLTTPPCSEGVRWVLMKTPMTASKEQIETFKKAVHHDNSRPVQPLNGRVVLE